MVCYVKEWIVTLYHPMGLKEAKDMVEELNNLAVKNYEVPLYDNESSFGKVQLIKSVREISKRIADENVRQKEISERQGKYLLCCYTGTDTTLSNAIFLSYEDSHREAMDQLFVQSKKLPQAIGTTIVIYPPHKHYQPLTIPERVVLRPDGRWELVYTMQTSVG